MKPRLTVGAAPARAPLFCVALILFGILAGTVLPVSVAAQLAGADMTLRPVPSLDQPADPATYLIRPGEKLKVTFINSKLSPFTFQVDAEGRAVDVKLGVLDLGGLTLEQAREQLQTPLSRMYNADDIAISVTNVYPVAIRVIGAVRRPGRYVGYTSQTVSDIIDSAGGVLPGGSTRRIQLLGGPKPIPVDLEVARHQANLSADPNLYAGYTIDVPMRSTQSVRIIGEVLNPGEYEFLPGDDFATMLALAGGPTPYANVSAPELVNDEGRDPLAAGAIRPGDVIRIPSDGLVGGKPVVTMVGSIAKPGQYSLEDGLHLAQLIELAGGYVDRANTGRVTIFRRAPTGTVEGSMSARYPVIAGAASGHESVSIWPGDSVFVPTQLGFVQVEGLVDRPGLYPFRSGATADDYVRLAGGFTSLARSGEVEIVDRVSGITRLGSTSNVVYDGDRIRALPKEVIE